MNIGGPAVLLMDLIKALPSERFDHTLITGRCLENEVDYFGESTPDIKVIYIDEISRSISIIKEFISFFKLVRILRDIDPDIVHTHTSKAGVLGRIASLFLRKTTKVVHTYHGHLIYGYFSRTFTKFVIVLEKFLSKISDLLIAVSSQVKKDLLIEGIGAHAKWEIIHPGISEPKNLEKISMRKKFGLSANAKIIVWVGRFTQIKNPLLAIDCIKALPHMPGVQIQLVMAGDGELLPAAKAAAARSGHEVIFLGWTHNISELFACADVLLMTSKNEGMPVVVIEAAFQGIPTVSTDVGGVSEFIEDGRNGMVCRQDSVELASKVFSILSNAELASELGDSAKMKARNSFSLSYYLNKHLMVYENLFYS